MDNNEERGWRFPGTRGKSWFPGQTPPKEEGAKPKPRITEEAGKELWALQKQVWVKCLVNLPVLLAGSKEAPGQISKIYHRIAYGRREDSPGPDLKLSLAKVNGSAMIGLSEQQIISLINSFRPDFREKRYSLEALVMLYPHEDSYHAGKAWRLGVPIDDNFKPNIGVSEKFDKILTNLGMTVDRRRVKVGIALQLPEGFTIRLFPMDRLLRNNHDVKEDIEIKIPS